MQGRGLATDGDDVGPGLEIEGPRQDDRGPLVASPWIEQRRGCDERPVERPGDDDERLGRLLLAEHRHDALRIRRVRAEPDLPDLEPHDLGERAQGRGVSAKPGAAIQDADLVAGRGGPSLPEDEVGQEVTVHVALTQERRRPFGNQPVAGQESGPPEELHPVFTGGRHHHISDAVAVEVGDDGLSPARRPSVRVGSLESPVLRRQPDAVGQDEVGPAIPVEVARGEGMVHEALVARELPERPGAVVVGDGHAAPACGVLVLHGNEEVQVAVPIDVGEQPCG